MARSLRQLKATPVEELYSLAGMDWPTIRPALKVIADMRARGEEPPEPPKPNEAQRKTRAKNLQKLHAVDVETIYDLLTYYPRRHIDRSKQVDLKDLTPGEEVMVLGTVRKATGRRTRQGRSLVEIEIGDGTGVLRATFFNQAWRQQQLAPGKEVIFWGKVDTYQGRRQMTMPVVDLIGDKTGKVIPLYPQSEKAGLTSWDLIPWVAEALDRADQFADPVPERFLDELDLIDRTAAFNQYHRPDVWIETVPARKRLAFDELFRLQAILVMRKKAIERDADGYQHVVDGDLVRQFHAALPFELTDSQKQANAEIAADLAGPVPMHRLLQGDVGAGKTVVAVTALLAAVQGGHQGALMAPTEVLAEQHFLGVSEMLAGLTVGDGGTSLFGERPLRVELLTNRTGAADRRVLHEGLRSGAVDILIGTHALLTEQVEFADLGVVVIDEQHRFGVEQRALLRGKGRDPDVLVMTATPIPRTAAMTVYGDLDVTVLSQLPAGRKKIKTTWCRGPMDDEAAWEMVRAEVALGRQAYVVCPLVEESEKIQARSATEEFERLQAEVLPGIRLGLIHGQMASKDKEAAMAAFRDGQTQVLVATTVIEVGVDVPNATVMVIEDADRFGIAQLHQLRGRVGRGAKESYCYLLWQPKADGEERAATEQRLAAVEASTDGFELAEIDLELRGEGTVLGTRQKGINDLKLASLRRDKDLVLHAREVAMEIVSADPLLADHPVLRDEIEHLVTPEEQEFLFKS